MTHFKSLSQSNAISGAETCLRLSFDCVYYVFVNLAKLTLLSEYSKSHASCPWIKNNILRRTMLQCTCLDRRSVIIDHISENRCSNVFQRIGKIYMVEYCIFLNVICENSRFLP